MLLFRPKKGDVGSKTVYDLSNLIEWVKSSVDLSMIDIKGDVGGQKTEVTPVEHPGRGPGSTGQGGRRSDPAVKGERWFQNDLNIFWLYP